MEAGDHKLMVEGLIQEGAGQAVFRNDTPVHFQSKYVPLFITTDHPMYTTDMTGTCSNTATLSSEVIVVS